MSNFREVFLREVEEGLGIRPPHKEVPILVDQDSIKELKPEEHVLRSESLAEFHRRFREGDDGLAGDNKKS